MSCGSAKSDLQIKITLFLLRKNYIIKRKAKGDTMKKLLVALFVVFATAFSADAYQVLSSKELGQLDAKNQNVVVKCTTDTGKVSNQTCSLRRYAKCTGAGNAKKCSGWQPWTDLRTPGKQYADWKTAASACCRAMGLR
jgi:hypothetical protein